MGGLLQAGPPARRRGGSEQESLHRQIVAADMWLSFSDRRFYRLSNENRWDGERFPQSSPALISDARSLSRAPAGILAAVCPSRGAFYALGAGEAISSEALCNAPIGAGSVSSRWGPDRTRGSISSGLIKLTVCSAVE